MNYSKIICAILFSVMWSSAFIAGKIGVQYCPPLYLLAFRFLLAGPILLAIALCLGCSIQIKAREAIYILVLGLLNNALYLGLSFSALKLIQSSVVVIVVSSAPVITSAIAWFLLREKQNMVSILGFLLGFCGVFVITINSINSNEINVLGVLLAFAGAVSFSFGTVTFKQPSLQSINLFVIVGYQTIFGGISILIPAILFENVSLINMTSSLLWSMTYLVLVVSVGATMLWFYLVKSSTASGAIAFHYLNPVFGVGLGWLILAESIFLQDIVGASLVVLGILATMIKAKDSVHVNVDQNAEYKNAK